MVENINILAKKEENKKILDSILLSRGIKSKRDFFNPENKPLSDPYVFSDMKTAVEIINNAIENQDKILIWGDFDADGVTSTSILCKTLDALKANYSYFLPDRATMGHGLNLKELLTQKSKNNVKVLITVDCGISNKKEIELIRAMGVKVIITDHHEPPEILPVADCLLNPLAKNALDETLNIEEIEKVSCLAGAGVAMKLAFALIGEDNPKIKKEIIALSAIGTISDVVPLVGENRIIAAKGLVEINNGIHTGVSRLFRHQGVKRKITSEDISFILAPRINAAGRLDSPFESIKLLIENNLLAIDMTIEKLDSLNKIRQSLCEKTYEEALSMLRKPSDSIILYNENWHLGIIGIVASKLVDRYNLPVFLITKDEKGILRSSVRGTPCFDIAKILKSLEDCFLGFGGHAYAGGFSADPEKINVETLIKKIKDGVSVLKDDTKNTNAVNVDIELSGKDLTKDLIADIEKMEPFGAENPRPNFLFRGAKVTSERQIGKELNHLSYSIRKDSCNFDCLYWKRKILGTEIGEKIDIVFKPEINVFNGEKKLQLITDFILNDRLEENFYRALKIYDHRQKTDILDKIDDYVKNKNGEVKIWANTLETKKSIEKFINIKANVVTDINQKEKTLMLFDYPPTLAEFKELMRGIDPENLHIMKNDFSKNPHDYISLVCGMIKFATNKKDGEIDIKTLARSAGVDETCMESILELLEDIDTISIEDVNKILYIRPPKQEKIHTNSHYDDFIEEFKRIIEFKTFLQKGDVSKIEKILSA